MRPLSLPKSSKRLRNHSYPKPFQFQNSTDGFIHSHFISLFLKCSCNPLNSRLSKVIIVRVRPFLKQILADLCTRLPLSAVLQKRKLLVSRFKVRDFIFSFKVRNLIVAAPGYIWRVSNNFCIREVSVEIILC